MMRLSGALIPAARIGDGSAPMAVRRCGRSEL